MNVSILKRCSTFILALTESEAKEVERFCCTYIRPCSLEVSLVIHAEPQAPPTSGLGGSDPHGGAAVVGRTVVGGGVSLLASLT